jgi:hypothetical protein
VLEDIGGELSSNGARNIWALWHRILDAYTQPDLTVKTDRLIALAGIIYAIERATGWRNIDGLWEPSMITDLLWIKTTGKQEAQVIAGPSWSWVSLDAPTRLGGRYAQY